MTTIRQIVLSPSSTTTVTITMNMMDVSLSVQMGIGVYRCFHVYAALLSTALMKLSTFLDRQLYQRQ